MNAQRRLGVAVLGFVTLAVLLNGAGPARAGIIPHAPVNGFGTFEDTSTGDVWLRLDNFFDKSYDQMKADAEAHGFTVADVKQVHQLLDTLPLNAGQWTADAAIMGHAPNRELMWGAYLTNNTHGDDSYAYAYLGDTSWSFLDDSGFPNNMVENGGSPYADMNLWAFQAPAVTVPEPSSLALLALGAVALAGWRRWKGRGREQKDRHATA